MNTPVIADGLRKRLRKEYTFERGLPQSLSNVVLKTPNLNLKSKLINMYFSITTGHYYLLAMLSNQSKNSHKPLPIRDTEGLQPVNSNVVKRIELTVCQLVTTSKPTTGAYNVGYDNLASSQKDNELTVKFHTDLLSNIIQSRELCNKFITKRKQGYEVNNLIKNVSVYYILKSLTPSGIIQNYHQQITELCKYLNCTAPTFYKRIKECESLGYLKRTRQTIVLKSFAEFTNTFDCVFTQFSKLKYNFKEQQFSHLLESAYLQIKEQLRASTFENKIKALPELIRELNNVVTPDKHGKYKSALEQMQIQAFKNGHAKLGYIFYLNPFSTCNSKTMCKMFGFKSEQSVAYLKAKLVKNKLVNITKPRVPSQKNKRIKHLHIEWDAKTKQTIWVLPDKLEYAPTLQF